MRRRITMIVLTALLVTMAWAGSASAAPDDALPGVPLPPSPVVQTMTPDSDVYSIALNAGDRLVLSLVAGPGASADQDYDFELYAPGAVDFTSELTGSYNGEYPDTMSWTAATSGTYYVRVWYYSGTGSYTLKWARNPRSISVFRFYNARLGTHFYTADPTERDAVIRELSGTLGYEGVSYSLIDFDNDRPLYRFYKPSTGTHFYTADPDEKNTVMATLGHIYTFEGTAYNVSPDWANGAKPAVHRFFRPDSGTHFYTADENEALYVLDYLWETYDYDGEAFYLGQ